MEYRRLNVSFIGLGKLGKIAAETLAEEHNVYGYDINPEAGKYMENDVQRCVSLEECVKGSENCPSGRDVILIAVQVTNVRTLVWVSTRSMEMVV